MLMTATPRNHTGRVVRKAGERDLDIASMDNEGMFGPDLYTLLFAEAIERGLLSDYRVLVVGVNNAMYREYAERGELVTFDGDRVTDARTLARAIGLRPDRGTGANGLRHRVYLSCRPVLQPLSALPI